MNGQKIGLGGSAYHKVHAYKFVVLDGEAVQAFDELLNAYNFIVQSESSPYDLAILYVFESISNGGAKFYSWLYSDHTISDILL